MTIDETTRARAVRHVFAREFDGELVLLDIGKGDYYGLDEIGAKLWQGLAGGQSIAEIVDSLVGQYEVDRATLSDDLIALVRDLVSRGLLEATST
jgi:hypothetical protein